MTIKALKPVDTNETYTPQPRTTIKGNHVVYIKTDADGNEQITRLSDALDIVGMGIDEQGAYYRVIQYKDRYTRQNMKTLIPCAEIGQQSAWQHLQRLGVTVYAGRAKREHLADYLSEAGSREFWQVVHKAGWNNGAYILPNGEVLSNNEPRIIFNGDTSQSHAYKEAGSLHEWRENVAKYANGNTRLCLAIGVALAAPMMHILGEAGGGFHIYGKSRDGKSTAALIALSVYGNPEPLKTTWDGTALSFANTALARNDGLLVLDEIGQVTRPEIVGKTAYSVIDGKTKGQSEKDSRKNRQQQQWRIMVLSTGEYDLQTYIEQAGKKWEAGQNVRLPSLPSQSKHGIYDTLHGFETGAALSDYLLDAIKQQHGTAGRAWIKQLATLDKATIAAKRDEFLAQFTKLDGQALTVAKRFGIVATALELSTEITGLPKGQGMASMAQYFTEWLELNGTGSYEDRATIHNAIVFFETYANTPRFAEYNALQRDHDRDHMGYYKVIHGGLDTPVGERVSEYYVITNAFDEHICKGRPRKAVAEILHRITWLQKHGNSYQKQRGNGQRYYVFKGATPPEI